MLGYQYVGTEIQTGNDIAKNSCAEMPNARSNASETSLKLFKAN
jgi:hypothetical protein